MKNLARAALVGTFVLGTLSFQTAFAQDSSSGSSNDTSAGGSAKANAGSSSDKTDKHMQSNANSADKEKQEKKD